MLGIIVSAPARRDITNVLAWSLDRFGDLAAEPYQALIAAPFKQLSQSDEPAGSSNIRMVAFFVRE